MFILGASTDGFVEGIEEENPPPCSAAADLSQPPAAPANPTGSEQLPRDAPLGDHIRASKVKERNAEEVIRILEGEFDSFEEVLVISSGDMLSELGNLGIKVHDRNALKAYCDGYR